MSQAVFPTLPGLAWSVSKIPTFQTKVQTSVSFIEHRASFTPYPQWKWTLVYELLRQGAPTAELESLLGFWLQRQGMFDSFLYTDPNDNAVTDQSFGTGDGSTFGFQLVRSFGGFVEPIFNPNVITAITINGVPTGAYSQAGGLVTFSSAPAAAATIAWTGTYYWRVRFADDTTTFEQFAQTLWENKSLSFLSVLGS